MEIKTKIEIHFLTSNITVWLNTSQFVFTFSLFRFFSFTVVAGSSGKKGSAGGSGGSAVVELTETNFNALVMESTDHWLVEFYAPW
jgi:hypothetical protein